MKNKSGAPCFLLAKQGIQDATLKPDGGNQGEMKNQTWIWSLGFFVGGSLVLRSGYQRSHLVLASFRFEGFIFILYWFSMVTDKCPEATKRLMGHKERSCIMEPSQFVTRPTRKTRLGVWFIFFFFNGQGYVLSPLSNIETTNSFWAIRLVSECHITTDLRSVEYIILCCLPLT